MNTVEEQIDKAGQRAAGSLKSTAGSVRSAGDQAANAVSDLAASTAEQLDGAAACVRSLAGPDTFTGLRRAVRRNPVGSLALATAIGVVVGYAYRRGGSRR